MQIRILYSVMNRRNINIFMNSDDNKESSETWNFET